VRRGWCLDGNSGFIAAMLFLSVGGGWAVISRAGLRPKDFSDAIVLLTAVHFHYAGFVLPVVAGLSASDMERRRAEQTPSPQPSPNRRGRLVDRVMLAAIIAGVPLVGVGISLSPDLEVAAAILLTLGCMLLAVRQLQAAIASQNSTRLTLLGISSLALVSAMGLAAVYAVGEFTGRQWLSIPTMIRTHGVFNAIGFATCGLAGWAVDRRWGRRGFP
ncbi:MAG: YndJ family protein, partial [Planctomycetaceae bacterium]|nr:YndJ family protein [Planctomycetaceae bacterium]